MTLRKNTSPLHTRLCTRPLVVLCLAAAALLCVLAPSGVAADADTDTNTASPSATCEGGDCQAPNAFADMVAHMFTPLSHMDEHLMVGAVVSAGSEVDMWRAVSAYLTSHKVSNEFLIYDNYERLTEAIMQGFLHAAWASPLGYVEMNKIATMQGINLLPLAQRDVDQDRTAVIVAAAGSGVKSLSDLNGKKVGVGALDAAGTAIGLLHAMDVSNLEPAKDFKVVSYDPDARVHGQTEQGLQALAAAFSKGHVDAIVLDAKDLDGLVSAGALKAADYVTLDTSDKYDDLILCSIDGLSDVHGELVKRAHKALLQVHEDDSAAAKKLLSVSGATAYVEGRASGYSLITTANDVFHYVDGYLKPYLDFAAGFHMPFGDDTPMGGDWDPSQWGATEDGEWGGDDWEGGEYKQPQDVGDYPDLNWDIPTGGDAQANVEAKVHTPGADVASEDDDALDFE